MTGRERPAAPDVTVDHVIVAVEDLEGAASRLGDVHGLRAFAGGRHPGHGTGNMIVPLGAAYLELMAVVDAEEAAGSALGRFVAAFVEGGGGPMALCLRTRDITGPCRDRGLEPMAMGRRLPDGTELRWRLAGLEAMVGAHRLPFFIEWGVPPGYHPAETPVEHPGGAATLDRVVIAGDRERLADWLGGEIPGVVVETGSPGVRSIHLTVGGRRVTLAAPP